MARITASLCLAALLATAATAGEPRSLDAGELAALKEKVRVSCQLPPEDDAAVYPWYFHYQLGLELSERQDWGKSADALLVALDKRPGPTEHGRTYGMWFVTYRPYFHLGVAQYQLGKFACATDAFSLSRRLEEIAQGDPAASERASLEQDAAARQRGGAGQGE